MPKRIQRKRTKGWRMPDNAVYVGRPTVWGNPFKVGDSHPEHGWPMSAREAVDLYQKQLFRYSHKTGNIDDYLIDEITLKEMEEELKGKDLACWCKEGQPCHADVLLEIANS